MAATPCCQCGNFCLPDKCLKKHFLIPASWFKNNEDCEEYFDGPEQIQEEAILRPQPEKERYDEPDGFVKRILSEKKTASSTVVESSTPCQLVPCQHIDCKPVDKGCPDSTILSTTSTPAVDRKEGAEW